MPYVIVRESKGSYKKFSGYVTHAEFLQSIFDNNNDPDFDRMRYAINDFLDVQDHSVNIDHVNTAVVHGLGASFTNAKIKLAIVTIDPKICTLVRLYSSHVKYPVKIFSTLSNARDWIGERPCD